MTGRTLVAGCHTVSLGGDKLQDEEREVPLAESSSLQWKQRKPTAGSEIEDLTE
jgi:hypothetical protein